MIPKLDPFELNVEQFGVVSLSVANLRQLPMYQSEMVNQMILGTVAPVFDEQNGFFLVQNWDNYRGWLSQASLALKSWEEAEQWHRSATLLYMGRSGWVFSEPDVNSAPLTDLVPFSHLKEIDEAGEFRQVELPDGKRGYVSSSETTREHAPDKDDATGETIVAQARQFLGIPYLWGGVSPKAVDCSGYVQTVFRLHGITLPRDACQMAGLGNKVTLSDNFRHLRAGDLLFFGKTMQRITHVAIYVAENIYIHAEGVVGLSSLDPADKLYNKRRRETLLTAKRLLGDG